MSLKGKIALITGAAGGIGRATALALAKQGCSIAVHYNASGDKANTLVQELQAFDGVKAAAFKAELSDYDAIRKLYKDVVENLGAPDILYNNAGTTTVTIGPQGNIQDVSIEDFEANWRVNTGSTFLLTQLCIPHMEQQKYGRIVFCSSVAAGTGGVIGPHYASAKSALHGLLHWISSRYSSVGITCNAVAPALIQDTGLFSKPIDALKKNIPVGRFGLPDEVASIVELLVTNAYMTNKIIVADGGWTPSAF